VLDRDLRVVCAVQRSSDSAFFTRLRGSSGNSYVVLQDSVVAAGSQVTAKIRNEGSSALFRLVITAYEGTLRLYVDEADASVDRFQVPEVLLPDLPEHERAWTKVAKSRSSLRASLGSASFDLTYSPFKLVVSTGGSPAVSFNADGMFAFEHRRAKGVRQPASVCRTPPKRVCCE